MNIGFIGCGNMGSAMIRGILDAKLASPKDITASVKNADSATEKSAALGILVDTDNLRVAAWADVLFLAVKPQFYEATIYEIRDVLKPEALIVSIAAGKTIDWLEHKLGPEKKILRAMPNTPSLVREGMTGLCAGNQVTDDDVQLVCDILSCFSLAAVVPESQMDVVTAISGSSPAYVFMFIEAMADAAVAGGMPRQEAYRFAAQAVLGSARMVLETGLHPGQLKDMVCSPGGTTIEAVRVLEKEGLRSAVMEAMKACMDKAKKL